MSKVLILFYNTMWDVTIDTRAKLPDGFEITADRRRYADASAAVFTFPQ
jgi:hypothetical protein